MRIIKPLLLSIGVCLMIPASAATVSLTGNRIGTERDITLSNGENYRYWAGIVELDIDGKQYLAMPAIPADETSLTDVLGTSWEVDLYSRNDILAGDTPLVGEFITSLEETGAASQNYSMASWFFLNGLLGYEPPDPLWAASFNEMVWQILIFVPLAGVEDESFFTNANTVYDAESGIRLRNVYDMDIANGIDPNLDFGNFMAVAEWKWGSGAPNEFLVFMNPVPLPTALWPFISGMIGLAVVARKPVVC